MKMFSDRQSGDIFDSLMKQNQILVSHSQLHERTLRRRMEERLIVMVNNLLILYDRTLLGLELDS